MRLQGTSALSVVLVWSAVHTPTSITLFLAKKHLRVHSTISAFETLRLQTQVHSIGAAMWIIVEAILGPERKVQRTLRNPDESGMASLAESRS